ncbi:hypothetical protein [Sphingopyxis panaciterrae]
MQRGEVGAGGWSSRMEAGLIHDIPIVKDLIDRIIAEAEGLIRNRLSTIAC